MGKIAKKKKGRPSKADLARRAEYHRKNSPTPLPESDRRSLRGRNLTYTDDLDDDDDEDERRREKKLKLVLRLPHNKSAGYSGVDSVTGLTRVTGGRRTVGHASAPESRVAVSASSSDYGDGNKPFKKRKIDGEDEVYNDGDGDDDDVDDDDDDVRSTGSGDQKKERGRSVDSKVMNSVPGVSLPDKKQLELIIDKLQKKDTYGVYAEPVDPEELPDYHDVIEHPMDFGTIRKKLASGMYANLEEFENDVFLVCTNAMQYNAPETIYFKQARSIQELARIKFQRLRIDIERGQEELQSEQKSKSNFLVKKPIKKFSSRTVQEPVGSDFSSGATLATTGDTCTWSNVTQAGGCERPTNVDGLVDGNSSLIENKPEKAEEQLPGKGFPSKFGRKLLVFDENRRATYNISNQPVVRTESIFTTFEGENKQLVTVGLHADHSYARSLARFAATLGPVAWKVASRRIVQALPVGFKFGRGWVGEYEPLPTPVLMLGNHTQKQLGNLQNTAESRKDDKNAERLKATQDDVRLGFRTIGSSRVAASSKSPDPAKEHPVCGPILEGKPGLFGVAGTKSIVNAMNQQQNPLMMNSAKSDNNVLKQVELNCSSSASGNPIDIAARKQLEHSSEMTSSKLLEMVSRNRKLVQSLPLKQPETDRVVAGGLPNGKSMLSSSDNNRVSNFSSDIVSKEQARAATYFPHGNHEQGLSDPVQMMRMLAEKTQNQQKSSNPPMIETKQVMPSVPSPRRGDSSAAATAAARAWMSLGAAQFKPTETSGSPKMQIAAASLYNPARELPQSVPRFREEPPVSMGVQLQSEKNRFLPQAFLPQPVRVCDEPQSQNSRRMVFPQLVTADLSRFQVQSPWQGLIPHAQPNKKQDMLPPDLNISFQSSGSPVRQSSGILVDSQQPDLALQL